MAATDGSTPPTAVMRLGAAAVTVLALSFGAVTMAFITVFMMRKGMIPDLHWILGSGRYILDHGRLPTTDRPDQRMPPRAQKRKGKATRAKQRPRQTPTLFFHREAV